MTGTTVGLSEALQRYLLEATLQEPDVLRRLREETQRMPQSNLQIAPEQGQLLFLLVTLIGARRAIEIGVFTGYSSICAALALPEHGELVACDVSEPWTDIARAYWREAGVEHKVDLRLAPAGQTLAALSAAGRDGSFDFVFIDAEKSRYDAYYEASLALVRRGGLIAFDNTLWGGAVADPGADDADTEALRRLNLKLRDDRRVVQSLVPIGDGLTLAVKR
jgi:predicted O-methyltransferase YrrM